MRVWQVMTAAAGISFGISFALPASGQILRAPSIAEKKLVTKVEPVYPLDAADHRIEGVVRIDVVVGKNGHIESARLISGHPLLAPAALQAVRQWVFEPTLADGKPVRVATEIDVPFALGPGGKPLERNQPANKAAF
jgi:TonB family protein